MGECLVPADFARRLRTPGDHHHPVAITIKVPETDDAIAAIAREIIRALKRNA